MDLAVLVVANLRHAEGSEDIAMAFDLGSPFSFPSPRGLLALCCQGPGGGAVKCRSIPHRHSERSQTCQEIKAVSKHRRYAFWRRRSAKAKEGDHCLAASMDQLLTRSCPGFDFPAADLDPAPRCFGNKDDRPTWAGALGLTQPLSSSLTSRPVQPAAVAQMWRSSAPMMDLDFRPLDLQALEGEKMPDQMDGNSDLAKAMLVQSQALTALVGQIAQSSQDPMADLSSGSSAASTRGSVGHARLQAELASHSGSFYLSVLRAMARRMQPQWLPQGRLQRFWPYPIHGAFWCLWSSEGSWPCLVSSHDGF